MLRQLLLAMAALVMSTATYIFVCIYGWGLEPKSFWWIIGGSFVGNMIAHLFIAAAKEE